MRQLFSLIAIVTILTSCTDENLIESSWDYSGFSPIESHQPFEDVQPAYEFDYWELVKHTPDQPETVQFRFGSVCKEANNPRKCTYNFFRMEDTGINFAESTKKDQTYYYLKSNQRDYNKVWESVDDLKTFLGTIDSEGDALLLAAANGYFFVTDDRHMSGIRKNKDGYDVIGLKIVSTCEPYQINKFLLQIDKNGNVDSSDDVIFVDEMKKCVDR